MLDQAYAGCVYLSLLSTTFFIPLQCGEGMGENESLVSLSPESHLPITPLLKVLSASFSSHLRPGQYIVTYIQWFEVPKRKLRWPSPCQNHQTRLTQHARDEITSYLSKPPVSSLQPLVFTAFTVYTSLPVPYKGGSFMSFFARLTELEQNSNCRRLQLQSILPVEHQRLVKYTLSS